MKKLFFLSLLTLSTIILLSWGFQGHRTVALISERHLTPQAKAAVADILGSETLSGVASWADEVRNEPEYHKTSGWHFLNEPIGLSRSQFENEVKQQSKENVYSTILAQEKVLTDASASQEQKKIALKFLIHFIGDAHQPMHISRAEDKGGNTIQVRFGEKGTNLHSLWDSGLLNKEGLGDAQLAETVDSKTTPKQIKSWQAADPLRWIWESYQISSKLYQEIDQGGNKLGDEYYNTHIGIVHERLEMAGIRLAGVLNSLFKDYKPTGGSTVAEKVKAAIDQVQPTTISNSPTVLTVDEALKRTGEVVTVRSRVYGYKELSGLVLVNLGAAYPNQKLTLVLRGDARKLAADLDGKVITVTGKVIDYKSKPEIEVRETSAISIQ